MSYDLFGFETAADADTPLSVGVADTGLLIAAGMLSDPGGGMHEEMETDGGGGGGGWRQVDIDRDGRWDVGVLGRIIGGVVETTDGRSFDRWTFAPDGWGWGGGDGTDPNVGGGGDPGGGGGGDGSEVVPFPWMWNDLEALIYYLDEAERNEASAKTAAEVALSVDGFRDAADMIETQGLSKWNLGHINLVIAAVNARHAVGAANLSIGVIAAFDFVHWNQRGDIIRARIGELGG